MRVGFVGLGAMGRPMAFNLLRARHELTVWARRPDTAAPLIERGAASAPTPAALAAACDAVFTMLTGTADVEQVLLGNDGVLAGGAIGSGGDRHEHDRPVGDAHDRRRAGRAGR